MNISQSVRRTLFLALLCLLTLRSWGQQPEFNCRVIPTPQKVERLQGTCNVANLSHAPFASEKTKRKLQKRGSTVFSEVKVDSIPGAANQQQAYQLEITPGSIVIRYVADEGLRYAWQTVAALRLVWDADVPCLRITDWPAYPMRGWLDDISRGPVTKTSFVNRQVSFLGDLKLNYFNRYTEHTLYNPQLPDVSPNIARGRLNRTQFLEIPNLQCFAHFEKTLRIPFYQSMMDTRANLNPAVEETYDFLQKQFACLYQRYPQARYVNINGDETEGLGSGRASRYVDSLGADEAYVRHINRVYDIVKRTWSDSVAVMMWGDIVGKNPAMLRRLPPDMQYIIWSYVAQPSYAHMIEPFREARQAQGNQFWVAPGVSHWSSIPQVQNYMQNIAFLSRDGYHAGALGFMNTAWDDSGEALFGDSWHAMAWGAEMAWNPVKSTHPDSALAELRQRERLFNQNYSRYVAKRFPEGMPLDPAADVSANATDLTTMLYAVDSLGRNPVIGEWFNTGALMEPLLDFYPSKVAPDVAERCDSADRLLQQILGRYAPYPLLEHAFYGVSRLQAVSAKSRLRLMLYEAMQNPTPEAVAQCRAAMDRYFHQLHALKLAYLRLWDDENESYSRDIVCDRYDYLGREVLQADRHVFISSQVGADGRSVVSLGTLFGDRPIYYTTDGRQPSQGSNLYQGPFPIGQSCIVKAVCYDEWGDGVFTEKYLLCHKAMNRLQRLNSQYSTYRATYSAGGDNALLDGELGLDNTYNDGHWQGYWGEDIDVEMNLGAPTQVGQVGMRFLQNTFDWILAPTEIDVYTSADGKSWTLVRTEHFNPDFRRSGNIVHNDAIRNLNLKTQYLRVVAKNPGPLPAWHPAPNQPSYLFCDEIVVE